MMSERAHPPFSATLLLAALLSACAASSPAIRAWEDMEREGATTCEEPNADQCVVLACDEGECAIFDCEELDPEGLARTPLRHGAELARGFRTPWRPPTAHRNWRRAGLREDAKPRMTFHFRYRDGYFLPAFPRLEGKLVRHHLFPQEARMAAWFKLNGINIHDWTMVIPEHVHLRIHRGARGGLWNAAWRQFMDANAGRRVSREQLLGKAFKLAFRFDIVGPIKSHYHAPLPPPGPQLIAP
ncbi:TIGR02269 family lipoprotein [Hyalangium rubrum]|uniref:TIGR02269 family lipoprotein n=1 Tax=Hyalangium rubrum TaxID=3103134 RepID=A0ABU5HGS6_9BACT|nr:TIGR02269 family lipoprotein [Hyalangium sp. s54d21]MDY7232032.1 TIGR02269 family lipoprotein [Hyalangium sp. s54d21]